MAKPRSQKGKTVGLGNLIDEATGYTPETPNSQTTEVTKSESLEAPKSQTTEGPKYLSFARKDTRLHEDQLDELAALTRKLNRLRKGGERITDNTLIRIAVDLLLKQAGELQGNTEDELRKSVGLEVRD